MAAAQDQAEGKEQNAHAPDAKGPALREIEGGGDCRKRRGRMHGSGGSEAGGADAGGAQRGDGGDQRKDRHGEQSGARREVAGVGRAPLQERERRGGQNGDYGSLPDELEQGCAECLGEVSHWFFPSKRSSSFSISSISSGVDLRVASAWRTKALTDPPKARSVRSRRICRCVRSRDCRTL